MEECKRLMDFLKNDTDNVLFVEGDWGVGKTYFVHDIINKFKSEKEKLKSKIEIVDISLFGATSINEVKEALLSLTQLRNKFYKKTKRFLPNITLSKSVFFNLDMTFNLNELFKFWINEEFKESKTKKLIIVFDDIERKDNKVSIIELMGLIDSLKIKNTKIIMIANEKNITDKDEFFGFKEKVIDQEIKLIHPLENAKENVIKHKDLNINFYECNNLRTIIQFNKIYEKYIEVQTDAYIWDIIFKALDAINNFTITKEKIIENKIKDSIISQKIFENVNRNINKKDYNELKAEIEKEYKDKTEADVFSEYTASIAKFRVIDRKSLMDISKYIYNYTLNKDLSSIKNIELKKLKSEFQWYPDDYKYIYLKYDMTNEVKMIYSNLTSSDNLDKYDPMSLYIALCLISFNYIDIIKDNIADYKDREDRIISNLSKYVVDDEYDYSSETNHISTIFIDEQNQTNILKSLHERLYQQLLNKYIEKFKNVELYNGFTNDSKKILSNIERLHCNLTPNEDEPNVSLLKPFIEQTTKKIFDILASKRNLEKWEWDESQQILNYFNKELKCLDIVKKYIPTREFSKRENWFIEYFKLKDE